MQKSKSLKCEPASEHLHFSVKELFLNRGHAKKIKLETLLGIVFDSQDQNTALTLL